MTKLSKAITVIKDECVFYADFFRSSSGYQLFERLQTEVAWGQRYVRVLGQSYPSPRLTAWYGEPEAVYQFSGTSNVPVSWTPELLDIKDQVEACTGQRFNSVLLNYYRGGYDGVGRHSDDEKELGHRPVIASLSLGATRRFVLHPKNNNRQKSCMVNLSHGALLLMYGDCQKNWAHSIPKTKLTVGPRINLTFRYIHA